MDQMGKWTNTTSQKGVSPRIMPMNPTFCCCQLQAGSIVNYKCKSWKLVKNIGIKAVCSNGENENCMLMVILLTLQSALLYQTQPKTNNKKYLHLHLKRRANQGVSNSQI